MMYMSNILEDGGIPDDTGVAIEYKIPQTSKRVDIILTGIDEHNKSAAVIVELKQWSDAKLTKQDGIVKTFIGKAERETIHPSYQAWTYAALLEDFNEAVQDQNISLSPCAYLHNMKSDEVIKHSQYENYLQKAPSFIRTDAKKLTDFIKKFIRYGDAGKVMYEIDKGKIKPSKNLSDKLLSMLQGNEEFIMIDDQKLVYETALKLAQTSTVKDKHILIVEGGPGTGKSVVAINLLVQTTNRKLVSRYITKNAAPRAVYESVLTGSFTRTHITNLFSGSGAYTNTERNIFDVLIVDEAHRLNAKSGMFQNLGENQIKEIIQASKFSIFFIDDDQRVTWKDIGEKKEIKKWANQLGVTIHKMELQSQFRCNGSDGYLAWIDNALEIRVTANETLQGIDYDFQVFDTPNKLKEAIFKKNNINNKARLVAGYCWNWISKKPENNSLNDITIDKYDFAMQWNLTTDGSLWIRKPESVNEVGCIHTCQGLEVDYIGVIIGSDIIVRDGKIVIQPSERAKTDQSLRGYKKELKENPEAATLKAEAIIKNTYRTLMTRGQKGCYIYCTDPETNAYFVELSKSIVFKEKQEIDLAIELKKQEVPRSVKYPGLMLEILRPDEVNPSANAVPIYDLEIAAALFNNEKYVDKFDWVKLPDSFKALQGHFVTRVEGESMNKRIPSGAWCLFKKNPTGSRNNKVVIIQHENIHDQDTDASYTVKLYGIERAIDGDEQSFSKIVLRPDSYIKGYENIEFENEQSSELKVIGELVAVIA
ncbi:DNA/RNA helicase domain-containing protein [Desulfobacula sp.]|uniref:DNA/RNA helicase domain-containing protein n=1 Tax=Desulfobacula sp. TaxID=2593537 RepID=UPI00260BF5A0|nr:DNA/RNA helicase domain-containing protein [Desulfobacula sp.]